MSLVFASLFQFAVGFVQLHDVFCALLEVHTSAFTFLCCLFNGEIISGLASTIDKCLNNSAKFLPLLRQTVFVYQAYFKHHLFITIQFIPKYLTMVSL